MLKHTRLHEGEKSFSVLLTAFASTELTFAEAGREGGGYDWESVVKYHVETHRKDLIEMVNFDPEGSMFCAYGTDKEALIEVGKIIDNYIDNLDQLKATIALVPDDMWD